MLRSWKPVVGVDIGSGSVKLVVMSRSRDRWTLHAGLNRQLVGSAGLTLSSMLASLPSSLQTKQPRVQVTLSCANVLLRKVLLPAMLDTDQRDLAIRMDFEKDLPVAAHAGLFFDYSELPEKDSDDNNKPRNTKTWLAIACSAAVMQPCLDALKCSKLVPAQVAVDLLTFAANDDSIAGSSNRHLYLDAGFSGIRLYALNDGVPGYIRSHALGNDNAPAENATDFLLVMRKALQQYRLSEMLVQPSKVFVYGGRSATPGLAELVRQFCGCSPHVMNPLVDWQINTRSGDFSEVVLSQMAPSIAVAMQGQTRW